MFKRFKDTTGFIRCASVIIELTSPCRHQSQQLMEIAKGMDSVIPQP